MKLANPACRKARKCQPFCGMCNLSDTDHRQLHTKSLFGLCRLDGFCRHDCGLCYGAALNREPFRGGSATKQEIKEQTALSHEIIVPKPRRKYISEQGLYGGIYQWRKK